MCHFSQANDPGLSFLLKTIITHLSWYQEMCRELSVTRKHLRTRKECSQEERWLHHREYLWNF